MPAASSVNLAQPAPPQDSRRTSPSRIAPLLLTPIVFAVHGYHPFAADAGLYTAGIRHILDPSLYPLNADFVTAFTHLSLFAWTIAALVRITHLPLAWILLAAYLFSTWLFLTAVRQLAGRIFLSESARLSAILLAAAAFTLPIAGTALFLMDPYLTARSFSTPLSLFAVAACLGSQSPARKALSTVLLVLLTALIHPLMGAYSAAFVVLVALIDAGHMRAALRCCEAALIAAALAYMVAHQIPATAAYRQAVSLPQRTFLFLPRWHWYEDLGLVLPLLLFTLALRKLPQTSRIRSLCLASIFLGVTAACIAAFFVPPAGPYLLVPLQILRSFHVIYATGLILLAGLLSTLAQRSRLAVAAIFSIIFVIMFAAQRAQWPGSAHIDWPGAQPANPFQQSYLWIRTHTPVNAVFALDPQFVYQPGENEQGFRAIAERDHLADDKDAGVVAVQPRLANRWAAQRNATVNINRESDAARRAALAPVGATWLLLPPTAETALPCPWRNSAIQICQLTPATPAN
jgi:hypothetical protein